MAASAARREKLRLKAQERERQEQLALKAAPEPPAAVVDPGAMAAQPLAEINFQVTPDGMMRPVGAPPLAETPKTVRVPGPLGVHLGYFQARHGVKRWAFARVALAAWRLLMREELACYERAWREQERTGQPVQPVMGPLYQALAEEMESMRREGSGE
ncbi:hypothetical protein QFZ75_007986 [Streptomyces sp. V3I8]|uniref:hypothetical protein n=1 Tax=Streptomyces sp. V3I8 TaxID=3042279 RepID=UPI0027842751|nr:hypothetical protein [Streptomyces sp. V3I8]MDQ1041484.1 hypothetical protein [Streptomyces sp. V3I8]